MGRRKGGYPAGPGFVVLRPVRIIRREGSTSSVRSVHDQHCNQRAEAAGNLRGGGRSMIAAPWPSEASLDMPLEQGVDPSGAWGVRRLNAFSTTHYAVSLFDRETY